MECCVKELKFRCGSVATNLFFFFCFCGFILRFLQFVCSLLEPFCGARADLPSVNSIFMLEQSGSGQRSRSSRRVWLCCTAETSNHAVPPGSKPLTLEAHEDRFLTVRRSLRSSCIRPLVSAVANGWKSVSPEHTCTRLQYSSAKPKRLTPHALCSPPRGCVMCRQQSRCKYARALPVLFWPC